MDSQICRVEYDSATVFAIFSGEYEIEVNYRGCNERSPVYRHEALPNPQATLKTLTISPNPSEGAFILRMEGSYLGRLDVIVLDNKGQQVGRESYEKMGFGFEQPLNLTALPQGTYLIQVHADGYTHTDRVVVR